MSRVIQLDCDGPCAAFDRACLDIVRPGTTEQELIDNGDWDIFLLLDEKQLNHAFEVLKEPEFWRNLPVKKAAQRMVEHFRREGDRVIFCTSPWDDCQSWRAARRDWLKEHFEIEGRKDLIVTSAKDTCWGNIFIDDKPANVEAWQEHWNKLGLGNISKAWLFDTPSNKFHHSERRIITGEKGWVWNHYDS